VTWNPKPDRYPQRTLRRLLLDRTNSVTAVRAGRDRATLGRLLFLAGRIPRGWRWELNRIMGNPLGCIRQAATAKGLRS
jgi:hypothetical protein